jgi:hypothetical protein
VLAGSLSLEEREESSWGLSAGKPFHAVAAELERAPSTGCREAATQQRSDALSGTRRGPSGTPPRVPTEPEAAPLRRFPVSCLTTRAV